MSTGLPGAAAALAASASHSVAAPVNTGPIFIGARASPTWAGKCELRTAVASTLALPRARSSICGTTDPRACRPSLHTTDRRGSPPLITFGAVRRSHVLPCGELIVDTRHVRRCWTCQLAGWFISDDLWLLPGLYTGETIVPVGRVVLGTVIQSVIAIVWTHLYRHVIRRRG